MDQANILIIGGGVVGTAIAHAVSQRTQDVFLVEQNPKLGIAEERVRTDGRMGAGQGPNKVQRAKVISLETVPRAIRGSLRIGDEEDSQDETNEARCVINAPGLYAEEVAALLGNKSWK